MREAISQALMEEMDRDPAVFIIGEEVGVWGGTYAVTKGFYDKYLKGCRKDCIKAGFSYFEPVDSISDRHDFDVPLDLCITPQNVYVF